MALSIVSSALVLSTSDQASTYTATSTFPVVGGAGKVLLVFPQFCQGSSATAITSVTANGSAMAELSQHYHTAGGSRPVQGVFAIAAETAGDYTIAASLNPAGRSATLFCVELDGADFNNLVGSVIETEGEPAATTITPSAADSLLFGAVSTRRGTAIPFEPDAGMTELLDAGTGDTSTNDHSAWIGYRLSGGTSSVSVGMTPSSSVEELFTGIEILAASEGSEPDPITGTLSASETGNDSAAITGSSEVTGSLAAGETGSDTATITGTVASPGISGTLAAQGVGTDTAAVSGSVSITGVLSAAENGSDSASVSGTVGDAPVDPVTGTLSAQEQGHDTATIMGGSIVAGLAAAQEEGSDQASAAGGALIAGAISVHETGGDAALITGLGTAEATLPAARRIVAVAAQNRTVAVAAQNRIVSAA